MVASAAVLHADYLSPDGLIEQNLGFARCLVRRLAYRLPGSVDTEELESDAYLGLMMAARTFDPERGVQFRTYATKRIYGQMLDGIRSRTACRRCIPVPRFTSMSLSVGNDEGRVVTLGDTIAADNQPVGHELEAMDEAQFVMRRLDAASRKHLHDRHIRGLQQKEIAANLGISASAVSQRMTSIRQLVKEIRG